MNHLSIASGLVLVSFALLSCGPEGHEPLHTEGGVSGTGLTVATPERPEEVVSTVLRGNVSRVIGPSAATEASAPEWLSLFLPVRTAWARTTGVTALRVSLAGRPESTLSDEDGWFVLEGGFNGPLEVIFTQPDGGLSASLRVTVPAGSDTDLDDIRVNFLTGRASPEIVWIHLTAILEDSACDAERLFASSTGSVYEVILDETTILQTGDDTPLACGDLVPGRELDIHGSLESAWEIAARRITAH